MNKCYVYFHHRLDTDEVFYVGKGSGNRAYRKSLNDRNDYWHNIVNKHGYRIEIYADNLTDEMAFKLEIEKISYYKSIGQAQANFTSGGEGSCGTVVSEKTREKLRQANYNRTYSPMKEESKLLLTQSLGKKIINNLGQIFDSSNQAGKFYGISGGHVRECCKGKRLTVGGMNWSYCE